MKTARDPFHVVATDGVRLTLADGSTLVDGIASWWTACHGYNPPTIVAAIIDQAQTMPHVMMGGIVHDQAVKLSKRLAKKTLGDDAVCFFTESGSVAIEVALKIAVQYWLNQNEMRRKKFVCFAGAYHGDTTGAMSVCDAQDSMHSHFKGYLIEQYQSAVPDTPEQQAQFARWLEQHNQDIAGIIIEPLVQMAAGMRMHSAQALNFVHEQCRNWGLLLIADEIATGFGRTGSLFAFEQTNFKPDILCLGKALTGGTVPLAATIAADDVYEKFHSDDIDHALMHGPTFTGHAIACAAANASLDLFESEELLQQIAKIEAALAERLESLLAVPGVVDVRIKGAIGAVQLSEMIDVGAAMEFFRQRGVFIRPLRDVVYLAPSFTISLKELEMLCVAVVEFVSSEN